MFVTVAICTLNRASSLRRTLTSIASMEAPTDVDWELIVVNNGCTDETDRVIEEFADRIPLRHVFEPQRGHSLARNTAIDAAKGDYIVWTDDDVIVSEGWLKSYIDAFRESPEAAVFGGPVIPKYELPMAKWVREAEGLLEYPYAVRNFGDAPFVFSTEKGNLPFGANFALRMREQRANRFDPELGLGPVRRRLGDETDVIDRILRSGGIGYWVPKARVEHCIDRGRQTTRYIKNYFIGSGNTTAFRTGHITGPFWFRAPRWAWRRLLVSWSRYRIHRILSPAPVWVHYLRDYAFTLGAIRHWRAESQQTTVPEPAGEGATQKRPQRLSVGR